MAKQKKNTGLIVLSVIAFFFFAAFAALVVVGNIGDLPGYFSGIIESAKDAFTFSGENLFKAIGLIVGAALALIGLIVGIIVAAKKKRPIVTLGIVAIFLVVVPFAVVSLNYADYLSKITSFTAELATFLELGALLCAVVYVILAIIAWAKSLTVMSKADMEAADAIEEEPEVLEEEAEEAVAEETAEEQPAEEEQPADANKELADLIRQIVREEMGKRGKGVQQTITGATFSGPLVVQYFNGMAPAAAPAQEKPKEEPKQEEPAPVEEPVEEPVAEEPVEEPAPVEEPVEEPAPVEETVAEEPAPVEEQPAEEEKAKIVRIPFVTRMLEAEDDMKANYNELKNEILSWGVKSRVSNSGDTFRLHRKTYIKLTIAGKSLKLYFALDPKDYEGSTIPVQDAGNKGIYEEIPLVFKVKSGLSLRRCKQLIQDVMEKDGLEQSEVLQINWVKELEAAQDAADDDQD